MKTVGLKRRITGAILCLAMACTLFPAAVFAAPAESKVFSPQLSARAKQVYAALEQPERLEKLRTGESVDLTADGPFRSSDELNREANELAQALIDAFSALKPEHPELFWLTGVSVHVSGNSAGLTMTMTPKLGYNWSTGSRRIADDSAALSAAVKQLAAQAAARNGAYEQLLYVHDWLTEHNVYNEAAAARGADCDYLPWTPLSALTDVSQPVCEGYAKAFKMVCDELGVPCILVGGYYNGAGHAWDQVKLGGRWYAVDATIDDPIVSGVRSVVSGAESRKNFLVGANTLVDGVAFSRSHLTGGESSENVVFDYPALSPSAYDPAAAAQPGSSGQAVISDVPGGAYYARAVEWAYTHEPQVTNGVGGNRFGPDAAVTRGQAMTFLWRAAGCPEPGSAANPFSDINASDYWYKAVLWANENHIANGTGGGRYSPNQTCSNAHIVTFLYRMAGEPGRTGAGAWYDDAVRWAARGGLLTGTDSVFDPDTDCPRKDVVLFLYRQLSEK